MTHAEQHRLILELKEYEWKMKRSDQETFAMMLKRDKDDEDLDQLAQKKLLQLHEQYLGAKGIRP